MNVEDYYQQGKRWWVWLHEKGGKHHELPVHHKAEEYLDAYIKAAGIGDRHATPLWRTMAKELDARGGDPSGRAWSDGRMSRQDVFRMVKNAAARPNSERPHHAIPSAPPPLRAYLLNGGSLEHAQQIATHESPRTTKLYDLPRMKSRSMRSKRLESKGLVDNDDLLVLEVYAAHLLEARS